MWFYREASLHIHIRTYRVTGAKHGTFLTRDFTDREFSHSPREEKITLSLQSKIISLYSQALLCYIRLVRHYSRRTLFRSVRDLVVADDWESLLDDLKGIESQIDKDIQSLTGQTIQSMDTMVRGMVDKLDELSLLQRHTLSEVEVWFLISYTQSTQC